MRRVLQSIGVAGIVAAYSDIDGSTITYYADNNGLGDYLNSVIPAPSTLPVLGLALGLVARRRR